MDEDTNITTESARDISVEMMDVSSSPPETAGPADDESTTSSTPVTSTARQSTAATSTAASVLNASPPPVEEQVDMVIQTKTTPLTEGEIMYIISGSWLKRFMAQLPEYMKGLTKAELEKELGPIDNSDIVDTLQMEEEEKRKSNSSMLTPEKDQDSMTDGPITQESISSVSSEPVAEDFVTENFVPIKQLQLGEDFEVLPSEAWNNLVSWYGLAEDTPIIRRKVVNTAEERGVTNLQVELHPPMFTVYRLRDPTSITKESLQKDKEMKPKKLVAEKSEGFQKFLKKLKNIAGIETSQKVRLWVLKTDPTLDESDKPAKKAGKGISGSFKQMVLDLQIFTPADKELIQIDDHTANPKYNGSMKLGIAGLATGGPIVIEEQSSNGTWITEMATKVATKFNEQVTVAKQGIASASTPRKKLPTASPKSGSSSPVRFASKPTPTPTTSSIFSRGRPQRPSRPLGTCGLNNLGNTCYMNSALQCLRSVEELSKYFLSKEYIEELNPQNPLAHHGKVARAYAQLLEMMFAPDSPSSVAPREFKGTIGKFGPAFSGYQQQDTQEFLAFLLDGMHEDLNRIKQKPYVEKPDSTDEMVGDPEKIKKLAEDHWAIYKGRNDSAVADLFSGLYKSTLVCPDCGKVSITFDPFMDLTLPLPIESLWSKDLVWVPKARNREYSTPVRVPVELRKTASIRELKEYMAKKFGANAKCLMVSEVYKQKHYKNFEDSSLVSEIQASDEIFVYELEEAPTSWPPLKKKSSMLYPYANEHVEDPKASETLMVAVNLRCRERRPADNIFGTPFFISVNREEQYNYDAIMKKLMARLQLLTTQNLDSVSTGLVNSADAEESDAEGIAGPEELVDAPESKAEGQDVEKDGFVDVTMGDATSTATSTTAGSDNAEASSPAEQQRLPFPLFNVKISKLKDDSRIPSGWGEGSLDEVNILTRLQPNRQVSASPEPEPPTLSLPAGPSPLFSSINSGRRSRQSNASYENNDDELYDDALEAVEPDMRDISSDEEDNTAYSSVDPLASFEPPTVDGFYGPGTGNLNTPSNDYNSPPRSPEPTESGPLIKINEVIHLEFTGEGYDALFKSLSGSFTVSTWPVLEDPEIARRKVRRLEKERNGIKLEDCLDEFAKEEVLSAEDPWYCPRCKEHRRASKKFELWKVPEILVMHMKRFSNSRSFREKIEAQVYCPIEGLDLSDRVGVTDGKSMIYDLIAVDNHYGGLGGGHYTAYVKNWCDGKWYYCDDGSVRESNASAVVTPAAYLLFYRRRSDKPLGGPAFEHTNALYDQQTAAESESATSSSSGSRAGTPSPSSGGVGITGHQLPSSSTSTGFASSNPVGSITLWGNSMTPEKADAPITPDCDTDGDMEGIEGGVSLRDEGLGDDCDTDALFTVQPADEPEENDRVDEIRLN
ncbi:Similar to Ubiquitin carboxyl-terminal hydrolase 4; acc. no. B2GUZ1 [Pyronema omphalodes CBS 100304]|uniref:ubiquitinyl hydrolase 1 n=1 Tax=Pyronema omphalodes (strain CBS 100304) TaxID=1076935 RepID=U4LXN7_PYROM|nr:Similar to Ubiquitin carboxyl-terminal hydrolase 4; acc. no. B2GUZ1 [Pyronema omphalodes CBS 100304]